MISTPFAGTFSTPSAISSSAPGGLGEIGQDIEILVPTTGKAFSMTVAGKAYTERKEAGRALMKEILTLAQLQQEGESIIGSVGSFDLEYDGQRFGKEGYRYTTMLMRTGADSEIELAMTVTPLGAISRLEHALDDFEGERERFRQRLADARRRLGSYRSRENDAAFPLAGDLADKQRQLGDVEAALSADLETSPAPLTDAA